MFKKLLPILFTVMLIPTIANAECSHRWSSWTVSEYADCDSNGEEYRYCYECDKEETRIIPATGHQWGNWEISDQPSCYSNGEKSRKCLKCYEYQYETIPAYNSHKWGDWIVDYEATCGITGLRHRYCLRCGEYVSEDIPINENNHKLGEWIKDEADALSAGEIYRECDCGKIKESKPIPKLKAKVKLKKNKVSLKRKKTYKLSIKKKTYGDYVESYKSSNKKVATVNSKGKITARKKGKATITVIMASDIKAKCKVTVK